MDLESDYPYWRIASGIIGTYPPLDTNADCDVVVIGGGVTGALIAFHLTEVGLSTIVLDRRNFGWGSTSASTALVMSELDTPQHELATRIGEADALRVAQLCPVSTSPAGGGTCDRSTGSTSGSGAMGLRWNDRPAALFSRSAAQLDPYRLTHGLLHRAVGAEMIGPR